MKENTFVDMVAELEALDQTKRDYLVDSRQLAMQAENDGAWLAAQGEFESLLGRPVRINENAHRQFANKFDIPWGYYNRVLQTDRDLLARNINHWMGSEPKRLFVRTAMGTCRAVLSDRYQPIDHLDVLPAILQRVREYPQAKIERCAFDDNHLYLAVSNPLMRRDISKPGDTVEAGFVLSNSETGHASFKVQPRLLRLVCANGMVVNECAFKQVHVGRRREDEGLLYSDRTQALENQTTLSKIADVVDTVFDEERFVALTDRLKYTVENRIPHPTVVVNHLGNGLGFTQELRNAILDEWMRDTPRTRDGYVSQYGLVQAITAAGRQYSADRFERRMELEMLGGKIANAPSERLAELGNTEAEAAGASLASRLFAPDEDE